MALARLLWPFFPFDFSIFCLLRSILGPVNINRAIIIKGHGLAHIITPTGNVAINVRSCAMTGPNEVCQRQSMMPKSGYRFSENIMLNQ